MMDRKIFSALHLLYMCYSISFTESLAEETEDCNVAVQQPLDTKLPAIIVESEQSYYSNTNGQSYRRVPVFVAGTQLNSSKTTGSFQFEVSRSRIQTLNFAYNGTHICSSAQLRLELDTCWGGGSSGSCYNKTNACDSVCFRSTDFHKRHKLRLFRSFKSSYDIGEWEENDYASIYTMPYKQTTCYHGNDSYENWDYKDSIASYPNLQKMVCPLGQRCRISTGKVMYSDPITTYVGCERDENQYDGCEGGCSILEYHRSPSGGSSRWVEMCKYCCTGELCNDPYKCKGTKCVLKSEPSGKNAGHIFFTVSYRFMGVFLVLVSLYYIY